MTCENRLDRAVLSHPRPVVVHRWRCPTVGKRIVPIPGSQTLFTLPKACPHRIGQRPCWRPALPNGLCGLHYNRQRRSIPMDKPLPDGSTNARPCAGFFGAKPCHKQAWAGGLCTTHRERIRKGIAPDAPLAKPDSDGRCRHRYEDGTLCGKPCPQATGACRLHRAKIAVLGRTCVAVSDEGEACPLPQGPSRALCDIHVRRWRKDGTYYLTKVCVACGSPFRQFGRPARMSLCSARCATERTANHRRRAQDKRRANRGETVRDGVTVERLLEAYGPQCHLCLGYLCFGPSRYSPYEPTIDHVVPVSQGGEWDALASCRPAHRRCNSARGDLPLDVWHEARAWADALWPMNRNRRYRLAQRLRHNRLMPGRAA